MSAGVEILDKHGMPSKKTVEEWLNTVDYSVDPHYVPSKFALEFVNFIKQVNGTSGEENKTPVIHYHMLDNIAGKKQDIVNMCARGMAKTTIMGEYLILYIAVYGGIPGFGKIPLGIYVSDSIENGVKNMRKNLEYRYENSDFLKKYIPNKKFTDIRWEFENSSGVKTIFKGYGAQTGVRGAKEMGQRPYLAILDDLISDEDARSATVIKSVEDTVYKALDYALHPKRKKIIWSGTPFNAKDPLYKAVESGAWWVNVYPVCETFPCKKSEFKGGWDDRFNYEYVKAQYEKSRLAGQLDSFNQELMLRIYSQDARLIPDSNIVWKETKQMLYEKGSYNFFITTDFATTSGTHSDYAVISVWATTPNKEVVYVDGILKKQDLSDTVEDLFEFVKEYKPIQVGIETSGQQKGFISYLESEMRHRGIFFNIVEVLPTRGEGKFSRLLGVQPMFKFKNICFSKELKDSEMLIEGMSEIEMITKEKIVSKHDDFIDTVSQLPYLDLMYPASEEEIRESNEILGDVPEGTEDLNPYYF